MLCSLFSESYPLWHLFGLVIVFTFSGGSLFRRLIHNGEIRRFPHDRVKTFLQRIGLICLFSPNRNPYFLTFSDFEISLKSSRNWFTFPISIWKEKKEKWVFVSLNHSPSQQRCFLPFDVDSFVRLLIGGFLPVFSGDVFPLDSNSSGRYFVLVQFLEQILTVLLWTKPPWKPPWKGVRDFGFGSEFVSILSAYTTSQNQIWVLGISNSDVGDDGVMSWPDRIKKSRLLFNLTVMKSYISVRKCFAISSEAGALFSPPMGLEDDTEKKSMVFNQYLWVGRYRRHDLELLQATYQSFCLIRVMRKAFRSFIYKMIAFYKYMKRGLNRFYLLPVRLLLESSVTSTSSSKLGFNFLYLFQWLYLNGFLYHVSCKTLMK